MMVTFISQCQKKASSRTRKILDAFANRIGDRAWQTAITEEGLLAVQKLLRQTASKNTAVSCHWIRSRLRSDLVWVVGQKNAFNHSGFVPVNFTTKRVIMDILPIKTDDLLANTRKQALSKHLFSVGFVAYKLLDALHIDNPRLKQSAFIAGILHDIGKIDPEFQTWVNKKLGKIPDDFVPDDGVHIDAPNKFSFELHPRHHELSWVLSESLLSGTSLNSSQRYQIAHAIYWHHTKPFRKDDKFTGSEAIFDVFESSLAKDKFSDVYNRVHTVIEDIKCLATKFDVINLLPDNFNKLFDLTTLQLPIYKKYNNAVESLDRYKNFVRENALNNLVRTAVISADRLVSGCTNEDLEEYLAEGTLNDLIDNEITQEKTTLKAEIERCLQSFETNYPNSHRNVAQNNAAISLSYLKEIASINETANIGVMQGPAGCGKTKVALEWALKTEAKKIIWVCPRVQVCLGLLHDLTENEYLPNSQIEIFTGEYKKILGNGIKFQDAIDTDESDYFSGDIVITTIDQVVNSITTHHKVTTMIDFLNSHVVFDEFHELVNMSAFNLLFAELIETKKQQGKYANTLLVSATPHYFYLTQFLGIKREDIISIESFNTSRYKVEFVKYDDKKDINPLISNFQKSNACVITNTALDAQLGYLEHHGEENSVLFHSKYTKQDKTFWFNEVFESFKRNGSRKYDVLRSGPIIQASLNITFEHMLTEITNAESWLQRLGRLDRFGENIEVNRYITVLPESIDSDEKQTSRCAKFLNHQCIWNSTKAWLNFLKSHPNYGEIVTINHLYGIYRDFYEDEHSERFIKQDLLLSLKKSVDVISHKLIDPISVPSKLKLKNGVIKISSNSLRCDNRFVQMAVCNVSEDQKLTFTEYYAYSETFDSNADATMLTMSIDAMRGYGNDDCNLVQFMQKKHHSIKKADEYKKARNEWELIKKARSPDHPIYLSYTPKDLDLVNSECHLQSVYYVVSKKQPVGSMSVEKLKQYFQKCDV